MSKVPYMPWYPDAHISKTILLTLEEQGALRLLLDHMWLHGGWLPDDDERMQRLLRVSPRKWLTLKQALRSFFIYQNCSFTNNRLLDELSKAVGKIEKLRASGKQGSEKRWGNNRRSKADANSHLFGAHISNCIDLPSLLPAKKP